MEETKVEDQKLKEANAEALKANEASKPREDRETRRIRIAKGATLETLVNLFFVGRSALKDPEGEEADALYTKYRNMWIAECKAFNKSKSRPFTLRGDAFRDQVDRILKIEAETKRKKEEENKVKDFQHWLRKERLWYTHPWRLFWYWLKSWGDHEKETQMWKNYYVKYIMNGTNRH